MGVSWGFRVWTAHGQPDRDPKQAGRCCVVVLTNPMMTRTIGGVRWEGSQGVNPTCAATTAATTPTSPARSGSRFRWERDQLLRPCLLSLLWVGPPPRRAPLPLPLPHFCLHLHLHCSIPLHLPSCTAFPSILVPPPLLLLPPSAPCCSSPLLPRRAPTL